MIFSKRRKKKRKWKQKSDQTIKKNSSIRSETKKVTTKTTIKKKLKQGAHAGLKTSHLLQFLYEHTWDEYLNDNVSHYVSNVFDFYAIFARIVGTVVAVVAAADDAVVVDDGGDVVAAGNDGIVANGMRCFVVTNDADYSTSDGYRSKEPKLWSKWVVFSLGGWEAYLDDVE